MISRASKQVTVSLARTHVYTFVFIRQEWNTCEQMVIAAPRLCARREYAVLLTVFGSSGAVSRLQRKS